MSNNTLNNLRKQLTFDFMLDFTVELTSEEVALLTLFENLDYSGFGTRLGRKEKIEPFRMMLLLIHGAMNNRTSSRDLERHVERDLFIHTVFISRKDRDGVLLLAAFLVFSLVSGMFAVLNVYDQNSYVVASAVSELYVLTMLSLFGYLTYYLAYRRSVEKRKDSV